MIKLLCSGVYCNFCFWILTDKKTHYTQYITSGGVASPFWLVPPGPSSSSPSLLTKGLSLEPSCSPCGHYGALDADTPQQLSSDPGPSSASLEGESPLTRLMERCGSTNELVNDKGPPELPATTITPLSKNRPPLPGPKPQGNILFFFFFLPFFKIHLISKLH